MVCFPSLTSKLSCRNIGLTSIKARPVRYLRPIIMTKMRCLITGAAGFVGSSIADRLLNEGHEVVGIDSFLDYYPRARKENNIVKAKSQKAYTFVEGDLLKLPLAELLTNVDWVFHQAGQAGVRASWGEYFDTYIRNNIAATQRLLEEAVKHRSLKKLVFASSSSIYGNAESMPTSERAVPQPVSPYGVTKLASEHLVSLYAKEMGVPTVSLRYFTVFGPRQRPDMSFHKVIRAGLLGEEFTLYGDGTQSRDFTFIEDIVEANILAAKSEIRDGVFNIGGGTQATMNDVLAIVESNVGKLNIKRTERQLGDARHTSADTTLARTMLGYKPKVSLAEGIRREVEWLRQELGK